ncbi:MAG TPA: hypothetical protein VFB63_28360 [Bryobacteraceae bacterium]|nr:hypothetical protein [Bryobacteraceae bacterium]
MTNAGGLGGLGLGWDSPQRITDLVTETRRLTNDGPAGPENSSLHRNLDGCLSRGSPGGKGFELNAITSFEIGICFVPYARKFNFLSIAFGTDIVLFVARETRSSIYLERSVGGRLGNSHSDFPGNRAVRIEVGILIDSRSDIGKRGPFGNFLGRLSTNW